MGRRIYLAIINPGMIIVGTPPDGTEDEAYSFTFTADGGTSPYTWAIIGGSLPDGLSLNGSTGEISGTPTTADDFSFTVEATDANGEAESAPFSIAIEAAVDPAAELVAAILEDNPFSYWRDDEESGSVSEDEINGFDCDHDAGVNVGVAGLLGKAIELPEDEGSLSSSKPAWENWTTLTMEILLKVTTSTDQNGQVYFGIGDGSHALRIQGQGGDLIARAFDGNNDTSTLSPMPVDEWIHVVAKWKANGRIQLFVNGSGESESSGSWSGMDSGGLINVGVQTWSGTRIDDVFRIQHRALYDYELSDARILAHAEAAGLA